MPDRTTQGSPQPDLVQLAEFLRTIHGNKPSDLFFYTWHLDTKTSLWHGDVESTIDKLCTFTPGQLTNLYTGVAWSQSARSAAQRVRNADAAGVPGLYSDIDVAHADAHKKNNLPPSIPAAHELVMSWAPTPSVIVETGHGLQYWWLFEEPWLITSDADRARLEALGKGWKEALIRLFAKQGWQIDSVHDLARVLRIPGTINKKPNCEPVLAVLDSVHQDSRYDPGLLMEYVERVPGLQATLTSKEVEQITGQPDFDALAVDPKADPPSSRLRAYMAENPSLARAWDRKGKGGSDHSNSGWDSTVAYQAALAGATPQEVIDILIDFRRKDHCDEKPPEYFRRTVRAAFEQAEGNKAQGALEELASSLPKDEALPDHQRDAAIQAIAQCLNGGRIERAQLFTDPPARIVLTINGKKSEPITMRGLLDYRMVQEALIATVQIVPPLLKLSQWQPILRLITGMMEVMPADSSLFPAEQAEIWVDEYLSKRRVAATKPEEELTRYVLEEDGTVLIASTSLFDLLSQSHRNLRAHDLSMAMQEMGAVIERRSVKRIGRRQVHRDFWRLPQRFSENGHVPFDEIPLLADPDAPI